MNRWQGKSEWGQVCEDGREGHSGSDNGRCEGLLEEHIWNFAEMKSMNWSHSNSHGIPPRGSRQEANQAGSDLNLSENCPAAQRERKKGAWLRVLLMRKVLTDTSVEMGEIDRGRTAGNTWPVRVEKRGRS